jgi:hypothetical protein
LFLAHREFRLASGPDGPGLACGADGVSLGGVPLLRKTDAGLEPRPLVEIDILIKAGYGAAFDAQALSRGLSVAARALNAGDLGRAMIATLHLRLPKLSADSAARVAAVNAVLAKYSPDQPRDWHGRWTTEGGGSGDAETATNTCQDGEGETPGMGDNFGPALRNEGERGPEPEPDRLLRPPRAPEGWDEPNGARVPRLKNGQLWPVAEPDNVLNILRLMPDDPMMRIYVPIDGRGPLLIGSDNKQEFEPPPGYEAVNLRGTPQRTVSQGVETNHALNSVEQALNFAESNKYSDIYFNRSMSTISNGETDVQLRPDVVAVLRPALSTGFKYDIGEVLSPRQNGPERERKLRDFIPQIRNFDSRTYKLLLKLLRALGLS